MMSLPQEAPVEWLEGRLSAAVLHFVLALGKALDSVNAER